MWKLEKMERFEERVKNVVRREASNYNGKFKIQIMLFVYHMF